MSHVTRSCELASTEGQDPLSSCITCGDVAMPMRVAALGDDGLADCVAADGQRSAVDVALLDDVAVGDAVLVHACVALQRLAPEEVA
jgi:hydrogenase maturation factor